jgi:RNA polymerase sigma-70 factor, ECF subfamily
MADLHDHIGKGQAPDPGSTSSTLLGRLLQGDGEAWDRMVKLYYPLVYGWCRPRVGRAEDTKDVVQEVFAAVAKGLPGFRRDRQGDSFRGWMRGIARHKVQEFWRRHTPQDEPAGGTDAARRRAAIPDLGSDDQDDPPGDKARLVQKALEQIRHEFGDQVWQAFWRAAGLGHVPADIAADLGITRNAVFKAKARVLARLREQLGDLLE